MSLTLLDAILGVQSLSFGSPGATLGAICQLEDTLGDHVAAEGHVGVPSHVCIDFGMISGLPFEFFWACFQITFCIEFYWNSRQL